MLSTAHTIISITLANFSPNPGLVFTQAFVIHFLADAILHWNFLIDDKKGYPIIPAFFDVTFGLLLAWLIVGPEILTPPYLAAILGGNLPDAIIGLWTLIHPRLKKPQSKTLKYFHDFHEDVQWETTKLIKGLVPQLATIIICLFLITLY